MADEAFYLEFLAWTIGGIDQAFSKGAKTVRVARVQAGGLFCGAKAGDVGTYYASHDEWSRVQGAVHRAVTDGNIRGAWDDISFTSIASSAVGKAAAAATPGSPLVVVSAPRRCLHAVQRVADKNANVIVAYGAAVAEAQSAKKERPSAAHELVFTVALAHGSETVEVGDFSTMAELYTSIAKAYEIELSDIVFITKNTDAVDMEHKLGMQVKPEDTLYAHIKGEERTLTLKKSDPVLGVSFAENGVGVIFVRTVTPSGIMAKAGVLEGEHVKSINGASLDGKSLSQATKMLQDIEVDNELTIVLTALKKSAK